MKWFGGEPFAPACEIGERIDVPVCAKCAWCSGPFFDDDNGFAMPLFDVIETTVYYHQECLLRQIVGSIMHQEHLCSCFIPGAVDDELDTSREAARLAAEHNRGRLDGRYFKQ